MTLSPPPLTALSNYSALPPLPYHILYAVFFSLSFLIIFCFFVTYAKPLFNDFVSTLYGLSLYKLMYYLSFVFKLLCIFIMQSTFHSKTNYLPTYKKFSNGKLILCFSK